jgi:protein-glutamine gamma-glutamyltransferase
MRRYFELSSHSLVMAAFLALAVTGRLDMPSIVVFSVGILWSLHRTWKQLPALLNAQGIFYLSCAYIAFFVADNLFLSRSFIPSTVHMVLFLQLAKLHQKKTDRDYFYLIILAFLMVLAAASMTIDLSFIATLMFFLISMVATLMSFEIVRSQGADTSVKTDAGSLTGLTVWASVWIIIVGAGLFFAIPRIGTGYFSRASGPSVLLSGFSDNVRLGEIGEIKLSSAIVMRVKRSGGKPSSGLKWRGIALDRFDGSAWHKSDITHNGIAADDNGTFFVRPEEHPKDTVRYDILLEPMATTTLFGPYRINSVTSRVEGIAVDHDESVFLRMLQQRRIQYQVSSEIPNRTGTASVPPLENEERYLQLPQNLDPRIVELAREISRNGTTPYEKASLIESYLRRNYRYTLNLTWVPGPQPLPMFLFDAKTGHCEYFASSMAILARAVGIPTRLVNGFQMGEFNPIGSDYIVRESDAHSWIEAYLPDRGWTEFDATPPDLRPAATDIAAQLGHYFDAMELMWSSYILVYDTESQLQLFHSAQEQLQNLQTGFRSGADKWTTEIKRFGDWVSRGIRGGDGAASFWFTAIAILFCGTAFHYRRDLRALWRVRQFRKGRGPMNEEVIEHLFLRAARLAERGKPSRLAAQTWREWAVGLPEGNRRSILMPAIGVLEKSKYSGEPLSPADFTILENTIRDLKRKVSKERQTIDSQVGSAHL